MQYLWLEIPVYEGHPPPSNKNENANVDEETNSLVIIQIFGQDEQKEENSK
jgi:hypothetical protein